METKPEYYVGCTLKDRCTQAECEYLALLYIKKCPFQEGRETITYTHDSDKILNSQLPKIYDNEPDKE